MATPEDLLAKIYNLMENQNKLLAELEREMSSNSYSTFMQTVAGGLVSAIVGGVISLLVLHHLNRSTSQKKHVADITYKLIGSVEELGVICTSYWEADHQPADIEIEKEIKRAHGNIRRMVKVWAGACGDNSHYPRADVERELGYLFDVATGGSFESNTRTRSAATSRRVKNIVDALVITLYPFTRGR